MFNIERTRNIAQLGLLVRQVDRRHHRHVLQPQNPGTTIGFGASQNPVPRRSAAFLSDIGTNMEPSGQVDTPSTDVDSANERKTCHLDDQKLTLGALNFSPPTVWRIGAQFGSERD